MGMRAVTFSRRWIVAGGVGAMIGVGLLALTISGGLSRSAEGSAAPASEAAGSTSAPLPSDDPHGGRETDPPPREAVPARPDMWSAWEPPDASSDVLSVAEAYATALHTFDATTATRADRVGAMLRWVPRGLADVAFGEADPSVAGIVGSPAEQVERFVGSDAEWVALVEADAYSVFSPIRSWEPSPDPGTPTAALMTVLGHLGMRAVTVEGSQVTVRHGTVRPLVRTVTVWVFEDPGAVEPGRDVAAVYGPVGTVS